SAGIVQTNYWRANAHGVIHYFTDFFGVCFRKCATKNREILCENIYQTAVNCAVSGNNAIAVVHFILHVKISGSVGYEDSHFLKRAVVHTIFLALAGGKFFLFVLFCNPFFAAAFFCFGNDFLQFFIVVGHIIIYFFSVLSVPLWLIFHNRGTEDTEVLFRE